jgi:hypothetical protein
MCVELCNRGSTAGMNKEIAYVSSELGTWLNLIMLREHTQRNEKQ